MNWKRTVPSKINRLFHRRVIDAAFISSITSGRSRCTDLGIVADGEVMSVILIPGKASDDKESATSNMLARILDLEGEVIIGDKALQRNTENKTVIDLSMEWKKKTGLPFVFARLCHNSRHELIGRLAKDFSSKKYKIPQFYLKKAALSKNLSANELAAYLQKISYRIDWREKRSLDLFFKKSRRLRSGSGKYGRGR